MNTVRMILCGNVEDSRMNPVSYTHLDSWETMYESYYYGYLIFAGRNKNSSSSVIYSDYRYYEIMADKTEIPDVYKRQQ